MAPTPEQVEKFAAESVPAGPFLVTSLDDGSATIAVGEPPRHWLSTTSIGEAEGVLEILSFLRRLCFDYCQSTRRLQHARGMLSREQNREIDAIMDTSEEDAKMAAAVHDLIATIREIEAELGEASPVRAYTPSEWEERCRRARPH